MWTRLAARLKSSVKGYRGTLVETSHLSASATRRVEVAIRRGGNVHVQDLFFGVVHFQVLHVCRKVRFPMPMRTLLMPLAYGFCFCACASIRMLPHSGGRGNFSAERLADFYAGLMICLCCPGAWALFT